MIIGVLWRIANTATPHDRAAISPVFCVWYVGCRYGLGLWLTPNSAGHARSAASRSFQWWMCLVQQSAWSKWNVPVNGEYPLHAGDGTQATALRFRWTRDCGDLFGNVGDVAQTAAQKQEAYGWHLAAARWGTNTLRSFYARRFEGTFLRPLGWPWFTDNCGTINMTTA